MPTFQFNKLIRDKSLQLHIDIGHEMTYQHLKGEALKEKLRAKLHEEADEIPIRAHADDEIIEEIGDVQQILDDLKREYNITDEQVSEVQKAKFDKKGGFSEGVFIETVTLPERDEWVKYYRKSPQKYPEVKTTGKVDPDLPTLEKGVYKHTKSGKLYQVLGVTFHTENYEPLVVYVPKYDSKYELFARPYDMFMETIEIDDETKPRFEKLDD